MNLEQKKAAVVEIKEKFENAKSAVVIDYRGITVSQAEYLRKKMREANVEYKVYKNTLVKKAIAGTEFESLTEDLAGPSAFAFGTEDPILPAKTLNDIIKEFKKMEFKAGVVEGTYFDAASIKQVAALPSKEELLSKFMGSIQSPVSKFVRTLQAVADDKAE